jgi:hypothetical protein
MPLDGRQADPRQTEREYEAFGGDRLPRGLYLDVGFIAGQADWRMVLDEFPISAKPVGYGGRVSFAFFGEIWEVKLGGDLLFLESFEDTDSGDTFEGGRSFDIHLGLTGYVLPQSWLRPFLGVRGLYSNLSFDDPLRVGDPTVSAGGLGVGAHGGLNLRLGRKAALELGASYTWVGPRDIRGETSPGGVKGDVGRVDDWQFISGFAAVGIHIR